MKLILILAILFTSCMPTTGGKEPELDEAINSMNKKTNRLIDTLQNVKINVTRSSQ